MRAERARTLSRCPAARPRPEASPAPSSCSSCPLLRFMLLTRAKIYDVEAGAAAEAGSSRFAARRTCAAAGPEWRDVGRGETRLVCDGAAPRHSTSRAGPPLPVPAVASTARASASTGNAAGPGESRYRRDRRRRGSTVRGGAACPTDSASSSPGLGREAGNKRFAPRPAAPRFAEQGLEGDSGDGRAAPESCWPTSACVRDRATQRRSPHSLLARLTLADHTLRFADYPFTQSEPNLGTIDLDDVRASSPTIPGLIEGIG